MTQRPAGGASGLDRERDYAEKRALDRLHRRTLPVKGCNCDICRSLRSQAK